MCRMLVYVYLVEHKTVLFSAFLLIISVVHHFNLIRQWPHPVCWAGISGSGNVITMTEGSTIHHQMALPRQQLVLM